MQSNGVDGRLLPLVILTELGGGLLVLVRPEDALGGDRAIWILPADGAVLPPRRRSDDPFPEERRYGRRLSDAGDFGPRRVVPGRLARSRRLGSDSSTVPGQPYRAADFTAKPGRSHRQQLAKPNLMRTMLGSLTHAPRRRRIDRSLRIPAVKAAASNDPLPRSRRADSGA